MLPNFLVEETVVREAGESLPFDCGQSPHTDLLLTLGITHAVEHESIEIEIAASRDGTNWGSAPVARFTPKSWCGVYQMPLHRDGVRYLKAAWRVKRWARSGGPPFFRFYILTQPEPQRAMAGAA